MTQPAKAQEPSMEEILASIRRIISDDDNASKGAAPPPKPAAVPAAPPPRAEAPARPVPVPAAPKPAEPPVRDRAAIESDIEAVLAEPPKPAAPAPAADADILDLTEDMAAEPEPAAEPAGSSFRTIDGQPDVFFTETPPEPEAEPEPEPEPESVYARPVSAAPAHQDFDHPYDRSIVSQATSAAVDSAFNHLAQSVFTQNGQTIEGLVREMLRPMLKSWLDDNLPGLVERLVRAEIERVSRGRG